VISTLERGCNALWLMNALLQEDYPLAAAPDQGSDLMEDPI
jgi:hypothetical protein